MEPNKNAAKPTEPKQPFKHEGEIINKGWDIPTLWCVDANNDCWANNAHGGSPSCLFSPEMLLALAEAEDDFKALTEISIALGRGKPEPTWMAYARAAGWTPPKD